MRFNAGLAFTAFIALFISTLSAQTPGAKAGASTKSAAAPRELFTPPPRSPEVHPDRTVTFRLRAPQATAVDLVGEACWENIPN